MLQKSTRPANPGDNRKWFLVDAKDQVLGRLAVVVANKLRAKNTIARKMMTRVKVFAGEADAGMIKSQKPETITL